MTVPDWHAMHRHYLMGYSLAAVGEHYGMSRQRVWAGFARSGLPRRSKIYCGRLVDGRRVGMKEMLGKASANRGRRGCWEWTGTLSTAGYPKLGHTYAHRAALELCKGRPLGPGREACHTCDNPRCVNPAHLFEGSHRDNMRDSFSKGRNASARLNRNAVLLIRRIYKPRDRLLGARALGRLFGVDHGAIARAAQGASYVWVR